MALDPSISLRAGQQQQQFDPLAGVERGMKLQQLAMQPAILQQQLATSKQAELASKAATEISQAQLPGVRATSTQQVREKEEFPTWLKNNGGNFIDPKTNTIDTNRLVEAGIKAGYGSEALSYSGKVLGNIKQQIDNSTSEQDRQANLLKYKNDAIQTLGNFLYHAPEDKRLPLLNQMTESLDKQFPDAKLGSQIRDMFVDTDKDKGITKVNNDVVAASRTQGMSPSEQEANKREWLKLNPEYAATMSNILPSEARGMATRDALVGEQVMRANTDALGAANEFSKTFKVPTKPGAILLEKWNTYIQQDPNAAKLQAAINAYNARNPSDKPLSITDGLDAVKARLEQENQVMRPRIEANRMLGERGTFTPIKKQAETLKEEGPKEKYIKGKIYTDAKGNKARYLGNEKWEEVK